VNSAEPIMDNASSAFIEEITYLGNSHFAFTLHSSDENKNLTSENKLGQRSTIRLELNADKLDGILVMSSPNKIIKREDISLKGKDFINLLNRYMKEKTPVNLTFSVKPSVEKAELVQRFELVYFQVNN